MATQHPDNASAPYWETDGDGFVSVQEEMGECVSAFEKLGVEEYMWDWEGKHADEAVMDRLFIDQYQFCKKHHIGKNKFLTFRIPNIWREKGYSLLRALMVILTSEDLARDLRFKERPLFEVILPLTERAEELMYIQTSFQKLARFKYATFNHTKPNTDYLEIIPLVESVEGQMAIKNLLTHYVNLHQKNFKRRPAYIRPFIARSDPTIISGLIATALANKIALSQIAQFSKAHRIPAYPIVGVGSLVFRGGCSPVNLKNFLRHYSGVRTVTIQSAFRYDYPLPRVRAAIKYLNTHIGKSKAVVIPAKEEAALKKIIQKSGALYKNTLQKVVADMAPIFAAIPRRRERRLHIGLLSYHRRLGRTKLPRAINFTAAFYTLGIPPEFIGLGRALAAASKEELRLINKYYPTLKADIAQAGRYLNKKNLDQLAKRSKAWSLVKQDIELVEKLFHLEFEPRTLEERKHSKLTEKTLRYVDRPNELKKLATETGKLRRSLG